MRSRSQFVSSARRQPSSRQAASAAATSGKTGQYGMVATRAVASSSTRVSDSPEAARRRPSARTSRYRRNGFSAWISGSARSYARSSSTPRHGDGGDMREQRPSEAATPVFGAHEEILEPQPGAAEERRERGEPQREPYGCAVDLGDRRLGRGPTTEEMLVQEGGVAGDLVGE